jgi:hypothetical protein
LSSDLDEESIRKTLKTYLDKKSDEINTKILSNDPSKLSGKDKEIYDLLKV